MNPNNFGKLANHRQGTWKLPLGDYIEECCARRLGKERPGQARSIDRQLTSCP